MLKGKTILVTGAARGLGFTIAQRCVSEGAEVILADILKEEGEAAAKTLNSRFVYMDLGDQSSIINAVATIPKLDGLVNNGAIATNVGGIGFENVDFALFQKVLNVNVMGTWGVTKAVTPLLKQSSAGRIVNVASDTALWGAPNLISYVASKGAVIAMTRSLARELGTFHIGITCIAPGIMKTASTEYVPEARHKLYEEGRAVKGVQMPEDITGTIAFLLTKDALALTGQCLPVDAGFVFT